MAICSLANANVVLGYPLMVIVFSYYSVSNDYQRTAHGAMQNRNDLSIFLKL